MNTAKSGLILLLGALVAFGPLSVDMYLPSMPTLQRVFGVDAAAAEATLSVYLIGLAVGQMFYGPVADRIGRKPPLYFGLSLYVVGSIGCAVAPSMTALVAARFVQALGGCAGMVIARAIVRDTTEGPALARLFSILTLIMGVAPILAPLLGGFILEGLGWQWIFLFLGAFALTCLVASIMMLPETAPPVPGERPGVGAALLVYGRLLTDRRFMAFCVANGFGMSVMFTYITTSPNLFIEVFGVPASSYGWIFGANAAGLIAVSQVNRALLRHYTSERLLLAGLAILAAAVLVLLALAAMGAGLVSLLLPLFVAISALGLLMPNSQAGAMSGAPAVAGSASALIGTATFVCGALAGAAAGQLPPQTPVSMSAVMAVCALISLVGYVLLGGGRARA